MDFASQLISEYKLLEDGKFPRDFSKRTISET
jgi:hypothetical protein